MKQKTSFAGFIKRSFPRILLALSTQCPLSLLAKEVTSSPRHAIKSVQRSYNGIKLQLHPQKKAEEPLAEATLIPDPEMERTTQEAVKDNEKTPRSFLPLFPLKPDLPKEEPPKQESTTPSPKQPEVPEELEESAPLPLTLPPLVPENTEEETAPLPQEQLTPPPTPPQTESLQQEVLRQEIEVEPLRQEDLSTRTDSPQEKQGYLINFNNVSIIEFMRFISRISNKNFIFNEEDLGFTISIVSEEPASVDEILAALMHELRIKGLSLIEEGNNIIIHTNATVNSPATVLPRPPGEEIPPDVQLVTRVFRLGTFDPDRAAEIITPLLSSQAVVEPLSETGFLILTDLKVNVKKVEDLLLQLDSPASGLDVGQYRSRYVLVDALAILAERILGPLAEGKTLRFIPLADTNTLFIISTPAMVKKTIDFLQDLDQEIAYQSGDEIYEDREDLIGSDLLLRETQKKTGKEKEGSKTSGSKEGSSSGDSAEDESGRRSDSSSYNRDDPFSRDGSASSRTGRALGRKIGSSLLGGQGGGSSDLNDLLTSGLPLGHMANTDFELYKLENRKGDQIQEALQQIADSMSQNQGEEGSAKELLSAISSVQWIESSNALVFTGTPNANRKLKNLIKELDVPNQQVLIELLLLDTNLEDSYSFGVDWATSFGGPNGAGAQAFLSQNSPLATSLNTAATASSSTLTANNLATNQGFALGVIGKTLSFNGLSFSTIGALISAIHTNKDSKVVLNQKILVEENNAAEIFVGLNVPFRTDSVANDFGTTITSSVEYRDVGARMKVTPIINSNGVITLEIEQELSTLTAASAQLINDTALDQQTTAAVTTRKSNSATTVFVPDNYFVILSGTIQDEAEKERIQLPCLGGIPVIGAAFSQKNNRDQKRSLIIFIRPSLLNTKEEIMRETKRQQDIYDQKARDRDMWRYEVDEALDLLNINDPSCP